MTSLHDVMSTIAVYQRVDYVANCAKRVKTLSSLLHFKGFLVDMTSSGDNTCAGAITSQVPCDKCSGKLWNSGTSACDSEYNLNIYNILIN